MVGDFNAHNKSWNCDKTDSNREKLFNSIENHNLFIHNGNSKTYVNAHQTKKSNLDLIISSINLADKINFLVSDDTLGSDHFPINFIIDKEKYYYSKKSFKIKSIKTNWQKVEVDLRLHNF